MAARKIRRLALVLDPAFTYYLRDGDVWRIPRRGIGDRRAVHPERVVATGLECSTDYIYYLDEEGDICCCPRP